MATERRFPVWIRIGLPPSEFGQRYTEIREWPDGNCGADGWAITPSGTRGVLNDAISIYFLDATLGCRTGHPRSRSTLRDAPVILAASLGLWAAIWQAVSSPVAAWLR